MGIGIALASGLVKGFTENIGREMERREAERTRLDTIENAILAAGVGDDFDNKNVAAIKTMLSSAREQDAARGGIDLFGTRGAELIPNDAMSDLIGKLQSTTEPDVIDSNLIVGKREDGYVFPMNMYEDLSVQDALSAAQNLNLMITRDPEKFYNSSKETKDAFYSRMNAYSQIIAFDIADTPTDREYPNLDTTGWYRVVDTFDFHMKNARSPDERKNYKSVFSDAARENSNETDNADYTGNGNVLSLPVTPGFEQQAQDIAANFGINDWPNAGNRWWNDYTTTLGRGPEYQEFVWEETLRFAKVFKVTPAAFQDPAAIQKTDKDKAADMMKYLHDATGGDLVTMSYILGAFLKPENFGITKPRRPFNQRSTTEQETNTTRLFAARTYISASAKDSDFDKIVNQHDAIERVLSAETGLVAFRNLALNELSAPAVISKFAKQIQTGVSILDFIFGTGGEEGGDVQGFTTGGGLRVMSAQEAASMGFDIETGTKANSEEEIITSEFIATQNGKIAFARTRANTLYDEGKRLMVGEGADKREMTREEMASAYARFEAMRISLAFQMARAADPSGRLSNQDVLQQLVRLGGDLDTPEHIVEKIDLAIADFEAQRDRYSALMQYASATGTVTNEAKLFIQGGKFVDDLSRRAGFGGSMTMAATPETRTSQRVFTFIEATPNIFTIDNETFMYLRDGTIKNVDKGRILDPSIQEDKSILDDLYSQENLPDLLRNNPPKNYVPPSVELNVNPSGSNVTYTPT